MRTIDVSTSGSSTTAMTAKNRGDRSYPQVTFAQTRVEPSSFYGRLRDIYANCVLKTQLEQLRKQGSYDAFKLHWHPAYDVRPLRGARTRSDGIPPSLFWESDVAKWIEAVCYFLAEGRSNCAHADEFEAAVNELVDMIAAAQQEDGYLNIYFTVVDPAGRFKNLRCMHEMYNAGHLIEAALAHFHYTGSRKFLDVMIKNVECFMREFGPNEGQKHGYPGHPELELAVLRLYDVTRDPHHLEFGTYLLSARGLKREDQDGLSYFVYEAKVRDDPIVPGTMEGLTGVEYHQAHLPIVEQTDILGHSVRAFYLLTGAADAGGALHAAARRLFNVAVNDKMYVTGGFGSEPHLEGFSKYAHHLPQSTEEGGCYAETCASIAAMMAAERLLHDKPDGKVRDIMELALLNAVLGGGSLDGAAFSYANKLATSGDEIATRNEWFEVCCCPPNLSRTLGMLGGYTWRAGVDAEAKRIALDVYLFVGAERTIDLGGGAMAKATLKTEMPWSGSTTLELDAPEGWEWDLRLPAPSYATNVHCSRPTTAEEDAKGFLSTHAACKTDISLTFDLPVRLLAPHPASGQDTLTVTRGPVVYVAESVDNSALDAAHPHFEGLALYATATFTEKALEIEGVPIVALQSAPGDVALLQQYDTAEAYRIVDANTPARVWEPVKEGEGGVTFVPWFARANRGGEGACGPASCVLSRGLMGVRVFDLMMEACIVVDSNIPTRN